MLHDYRFGTPAQHRDHFVTCEYRVVFVSDPFQNRFFLCSENVVSKKIEINSTTTIYSKLERSCANSYILHILSCSWKDSAGCCSHCHCTLLVVKQ